jgi:hypothetical protein
MATVGRPPLADKNTKRTPFQEPPPSGPPLKKKGTPPPPPLLPERTPLPPDLREGDEPCICAKEDAKGTYKSANAIKIKGLCDNPSVGKPRTKLCNERLEPYTSGNHIALSIKTTSKSDIISWLDKIIDKKQLEWIVRSVSEQKMESISEINKEKDLQLKMKEEHLAPDIVSVVVLSTDNFKYDAILDALAQAVYVRHEDKTKPVYRMKPIWLELISIMVPSEDPATIYESMMAGTYKSIPYTKTTWLERPFNITADSLRAIGIDPDRVEEVILIMERCGEASGVTADGIVRLTRKLVERGILAIDYKLDNTCNTITASPSSEEPDPLPVRLVDFGTGFFPDPTIVESVNRTYRGSAPDSMFNSMMLIFTMETFWTYKTTQHYVQIAQSAVEKAQSAVEEAESEIKKAELELKKAELEEGLAKAKAKAKVYTDLLKGLKDNGTIRSLSLSIDDIIEYLKLYEGKRLDFTPLFLLVHYTLGRPTLVESYLKHETSYTDAIKRLHKESMEVILTEISGMLGGSKRKTRRRTKKHGKKGRTRRR